MRKKTRKNQVLDYLCINSSSDRKLESSFIAEDISDALDIARNEASRILNQLTQEGSLKKVKGRPVRYYLADKGYDDHKVEDEIFGSLIGVDGSLKQAINLCKSAVMYPPNGLNMLITGETGVGKSYFAEIIGKYAKVIRKTSKDIITFNCSTYANNPQLLLSILFGHCKGAFTDACSDNPGLVELADGGILFLDEVHSLPPIGQEMLFTLIDKGVYKRLGETQKNRRTDILLVMATTENPSEKFLPTFLRRIPVHIHIPSFRDRPMEEKYSLISSFFIREMKKLNICKILNIPKDVMNALIWYDWPGNIGQLDAEIKIICSQLFVKIKRELRYIKLTLDELPKRIVNNYSMCKNTVLDEDNFAMELNIDNYESLLRKDVYDMIFIPNIVPNNNENLGEKEIIEKISEAISHFLKKWHGFISLQIINDLYKKYGTIVDRIEAKGIDINNSSYREYLLLLLYITMGREKGNKPNYGLCRVQDILECARSEMVLDNNIIKDLFNIMKQEYDWNFYLEDEIIFTVALNQIRNIKTDKYKIITLGEGEDSAESKIIPLVKRLTRAQNIECIHIDEHDDIGAIACHINEDSLYSYKGGILYLSPAMAMKLVQRELGRNMDKPLKIVNGNVTTSSAILAVTKTNQVYSNKSLEDIVEELINASGAGIRKESNKKDQLDIFFINCHECESVISRLSVNTDKIKPIIGIDKDMEVNIKSIDLSKLRILDIYFERGTNNGDALVIDLIGIRKRNMEVPYIPFYKLFTDKEEASYTKGYCDLSIDLINKTIEKVNNNLLNSFLTLVDVGKGKEIFIKFMGLLLKNREIELSYINIDNLYINFLFMLERCYAGIAIKNHPYEKQLERYNNTLTLIDSSLRQTVKTYPFKYSQGEVVQLLNIISL